MIINFMIEYQDSIYHTYIFDHIPLRQSTFHTICSKLIGLSYPNKLHVYLNSYYDVWLHLVGKYEPKEGQPEMSLQFSKVLAFGFKEFTVREYEQLDAAMTFYAQFVEQILIELDAIEEKNHILIPNWMEIYVLQIERVKKLIKASNDRLFRKYKLELSLWEKEMEERKEEKNRPEKEQKYFRQPKPAKPSPPTDLAEFKMQKLMINCAQIFIMEINYAMQAGFLKMPPNNTWDIQEIKTQFYLICSKFKTLEIILR